MAAPQARHAAASGPPAATSASPHRCLADKDIAPKTVNDLKLINAGRILENNRTLAESRVPVGEVPGSVITMHVVVRPPQADKNSEKQLANSPKQTRCGCIIL